MTETEARSAASERALMRLLGGLEAQGYDFVTPTPLTHARVLARRAGAEARDVRDVLGWNQAFDAARFGEVFDLLQDAGALARADGLWRSTVRVSRLHGRLFLHSGFPTQEENAVFLGPDSYRFADFILRELDAGAGGRIVDLGAGAGVGAVTAAALAQQARVVASDVNPYALRLARINAAQAGVRLETVLADGLDGVEAGVDVVLANPPYMAASTQTYRDGGGMHGGGVSLDWARAALGKLSPGGRLLLYTGSAIVDGGGDRLKAALVRLADEAGAGLTYREIDPDVFGEELETEAYADVERIAVVGAVLTASGPRSSPGRGR